MISRRDFVAVGAGAVVVGSAQVVLAQQGTPQLERDEVEEFVRVAHFDLEKVTAMVEKNPAIIRAQWDWGGGDFESALGAAAHMGRKDIAGFLLSKGASFDLFAAAMMGELDVVKAVIGARPELARSKGAHGLSLMYHAERGEAGDVVGWLEARAG